jgi:aminoglycoside phosphotransferase (APT) family kinase protein
LAQVHQASVGFDTTGAVWQIPAHSPAEVICLNDVAPYNMVFDEAHQLTGLIDVDTASPGPRVWDLAYLAYRLAPLSQVEDTGAGTPSLTVRRDRVALLCQAYADAGDRVVVGSVDVLRTAIARLEDLAAFTAARAAAGATQVAAHVQLYHADARWIEQNLGRLGSGENDVWACHPGH